MNATEYKIYHENYMQNNYGSTGFHTFCCIFFTVQCSLYISLLPRISIPSQYTCEYLIIVLPMILAHTVLANHIYVLNCVVFIILAYKLLNYRNFLGKFNTKNVFINNRIPIITSLRGLTYLITGLCILAVDFQDFPRYLAKTEQYGYSLMDTGVGLFVAMSGLVHKDVRKESFRNVVKGNFKIIVILLLLGVSRFVSVKLFDYQEHVTEYGLHWNFFFTIAVCKVLSTVFLYLSDQALILSITILVIHEMILYIGVENWVFSDIPRDSLITANREGVSSCLGYVAIYLFSVHIRQILLNKNVTKYETLKRLVCGCIVLWIVFKLKLVRPSRTLANTGYCIFIDVILMTITSIKYFVMVLCEDKYNQVPIILSNINTNGLSYFLIANLLTGAVNLAIRTLLVSSIVTFIILNVYMMLTLASTVVFKTLGFKT